MINYAELLPPNWKSMYLPFWFQEDFPALDISTAILNDEEARGQILFKSGKCVLAGRPFVDGIFDHLHCRYFDSEGNALRLLVLGFSGCLMRGN